MFALLLCGAASLTLHIQFVCRTACKRFVRARITAEVASVFHQKVFLINEQAHEFAPMFPSADNGKNLNLIKIIWTFCAA